MQAFLLGNCQVINDSAFPKSDSTFAEVIRRHFNFDFVARQNLDVVFTHLSRNVRGYHMPIFEFDPKRCVGQRVNNFAFEFNAFFFSHNFFVLKRAALIDGGVY